MGAVGRNSDAVGEEVVRLVGLARLQRDVPVELGVGGKVAEQPDAGAEHGDLAGLEQILGGLAGHFDI